MKTFFLKNKVKISLIFILFVSLIACSKFTIGILSEYGCLEQECIVHILIPPPLSRVPEKAIFVAEQEIYVRDFREAHKDFPYKYILGINYMFPKEETLYVNVTGGTSVIMDWSTFLLLQGISLLIVVKLISSIEWGEFSQELKRIVQLQKERRKKKITS